MVAKNFKSWPKGWPKSLNYPEIPIYELLNQTAMRAPNRIAIIYSGTEVTYSELKELSGRFAWPVSSVIPRDGVRSSGLPYRGRTRAQTGGPACDDPRHP